MSDELLPHYNQELSYLRKLAAQFAEAHPKIAGRLRLGADASEDPHVERLLEGFAFLTARIRHKIEDDLPELSESLLSILYPHYQAPIPSMAVIQLDLSSDQNELTKGCVIPRQTLLETEPIQGEPCRFRTCYPVHLWPVEVKSAAFQLPPFAAPMTPHSKEAAAVLKIVLACRGAGVRFPSLTMPAARFFLKGQAQYIHQLYELIFNNVMEVALARSPDDPEPILLEKEAVHQVGFEREEGMLPYAPRSFLGYRLLTEFFTFPEKFLFFEVNWETPQALKPFGPQLEIYLYLNRTGKDLPANVSADTFRLGCTPMVNLYRHRAEPMQLTQTDFEYRIVPDARRPLSHEVYSVNEVKAYSPEGEEVRIPPFFSIRHGSEQQGRRYWHAARRTAEHTGDITDRGTEVYLSFVDLDFQHDVPSDWTVDIETTCCNRDLPSRLPFGGDQPQLQMSEGGALISRIRCLTPPTRTFRPALRKAALWKIISHLSLNHMSLVEHGDKAEALRELLKIYDFADSAETRKMIEGIIQVSSQRVIGRVTRGMAGAFCYGLEVTIQFDPEKFTGSGLYLFASVLERFLALYCTVNSFTKLVATVKGREGVLKRWSPRTGEKLLV
jgi:type VI secretion system protein ImpG